MVEANDEKDMEWSKELQSTMTPKQLQIIVWDDARVDVAQCDGVPTGGAVLQPKPVTREVEGDEYASELSWDDAEFGDDEVDIEAAMEVFDPTCLLTVVDALQGLTKGITFDPASGEIV